MGYGNRELRYELGRFALERLLQARKLWVVPGVHSHDEPLKSVAAADHDLAWSARPPCVGKCHLERSLALWIRLAPGMEMDLEIACRPLLFLNGPEDLAA